MTMELKGMDHKQLDELIAQASQQKERLQRERRNEVKARLTKLAREEGYTVEELFGTRARSRTAGTKVPAKYRNPSNPSQTWSGRGKQPRWYAEALSRGKKESDLLI